METETGSNTTVTPLGSKDFCLCFVQRVPQHTLVYTKPQPFQRKLFCLAAVRSACGIISRYRASSVMAAMTMALSTTQPVIGPGVSSVLANGMMPLRSSSPTVGLSPARELRPEGDKIEPEVSVPRVAAA